MAKERAAKGDKIDRSLAHYRNIHPRLEALKKQWSEELSETVRRREVRYANQSVVELRRRGKIKKHQTFIPRRICDSNIRREQPARINYISQSRDLAKFRPKSKLMFPVEILEREFTEFGQYPGWQMPFFQAVDGASTHGWDAVEVVFDPSKPGHYQNRHIGHEFLLFARDSIDLQEAPILAIVYGATMPQLEDWTEEFGFDPVQVEEVRKALDSQKDHEDSKVKIYKVYYKEGRCVYVGWQCDHCRDWLKSPDKLYLGIVEDGQKVYETEYPVKLLRYDISENELIVDTKGRVFRDEHDQEALTQVTSALVNRMIICSWILFARKDPADNPIGQTQTEVELGPDKILDPGSFFSVDPPDPGLFSGIMALTSMNANEANQVNFAAMNRKDSRKTAKEMSVAESQAAQLSAVDVMLLSLFLQDVFTLNWRIFRSQVLQRKIISALDNWKHYYEAEYALVPSGDMDVVRRQEINAAMKQDWPVVQTTGAAEEFLKDLMRASPYAENAQKYIDAMAAANHKDDLLMGMKNALETLTMGPDGKILPHAQQFAPQLKELAMKFEQLMNPQGAGKEPANEGPLEDAA